VTTNVVQHLRIALGKRKHMRDGAADAYVPEGSTAGLSARRRGGGRLLTHRRRVSQRSGFAKGDQ